MYICKYCGQEYRFVHQCYESQPQKVKDANEKPFKEALEQGRRTVIINNTAAKPEWMAKIADKYGFAIKQVNQTGTMPPFSVPLYMIIAEKVITAEKETKFINCSYCQTRYDSNEYFKCPQCGSPTAIPETTTIEKGYVLNTRSLKSQTRITKNCPTCNKTISSDSNFCPY